MTATKRIAMPRSDSKAKARGFCSRVVCAVSMAEKAMPSRVTWGVGKRQGCLCTPVCSTLEWASSSSRMTSEAKFHFWACLITCLPQIWTVTMKLPLFAVPLLSALYYTPETTHSSPRPLVLWHGLGLSSAPFSTNLTPAYRRLILVLLG